MVGVEVAANGEAYGEHGVWVRVGVDGDGRADGRAGSGRWGKKKTL